MRGSLVPCTLQVLLCSTCSFSRLWCKPTFIQEQWGKSGVSRWKINVAPLLSLSALWSRSVLQFLFLPSLWTPLSLSYNSPFLPPLSKSGGKWSGVRALPLFICKTLLLFRLEEKWDERQILSQIFTRQKVCMSFKKWWMHGKAAATKVTLMPLFPLNHENMIITSLYLLLFSFVFEPAWLHIAFHI